MITREQVADLQAGDVVELTLREFEGGSAVARGSLMTRSDLPTAALFVGDYCVRDRHGDSVYGECRSLTVVSRAPRPLYVNHPRTEPVPGDVAADWESEDDGCRILLRTAGQRFPAKWVDQNGMERTYRQPARLRLLVDGETGQVVP